MSNDLCVPVSVCVCVYVVLVHAPRAVGSGGARGAVAPPGRWPSTVESPIAHKSSAHSTK